MNEKLDEMTRELLLMFDGTDPEEIDRLRNEWLAELESRKSELQKPDRVVEADYLALVHVNHSFSYTAFLAAIFASISLSTTRSAARMAISSFDMQSASWQASVERK